MPSIRRRAVRKYFSKPRKGYRTYGQRKCFKGHKVPNYQVEDVSDAPQDSISEEYNALQQSCGTAVCNGFRGFTPEELIQPVYIWFDVGAEDENGVLADEDLHKSNKSNYNETGLVNGRRDILSLLTPSVMEKKPRLRVLSLFDGIATGYFVLTQRLGLDVEVYYSSEIDADAISVIRENFADKVTCLGSVCDLGNDKLNALGNINLLLGGSPCEELSLVNPRRKGLFDSTGSGALFFHYVRIRDFLQEKNRNHVKFFWFFENTRAMEKITEKEITRCLGCPPVKRCSSEFVAMKRCRYYWGNVPGMYDAPPQVVPLPLQCFLKPHRKALAHVLPTITTSRASQRSGADRKLPVEENGIECAMSPHELEQAYGLKKNYTDCSCLSTGARQRLLGKSWSAFVVQFLLRALKNLFKATEVSVS